MQQHRALLELRRFRIDPTQHQPQLGTVAAAQATQLEHLLGKLPATVAELPGDLRFDLLRRLADDLLENRAPLRQQLRTERRLELGQPARDQAIGIARDPGAERESRRQRKHALRLHPEPVRGLALLSGDLRLDLARHSERIVKGVDLVQDNEARRRMGAEMIAPDRHVGARHPGVGAEDEDRRMRARQQAQGQLRLGPDGVEPRRVEHDQTLLEQRMRVVDQGVAPGRHLDPAIVIGRRVVFRMLVVPEAEGPGPLMGDPFGSCHREHRLGQLLGVVDVEREPAPGSRLRPKLAQG